jgi:hypothetical protein
MNNPVHDNNDCDNYYNHCHKAVKQSRHLFTSFGLLWINFPFICCIRL